MAPETQLAEVIYNGVRALIGIIGFLYGGYQFFDGWTNDQPEAKKKGIQVLLVTVIALVIFAKAKPIVMGMI